jgi:hypothetical protein
MSYHADVKSARLAAEKTATTAPTATNTKQHAYLNLLEIRIADLKKTVADINTAGGLLDTNASAALTALLGVL